MMMLLHSHSLSNNDNNTAYNAADFIVTQIENDKDCQYMLCPTAE